VTPLGTDASAVRTAPWRRPAVLLAVLTAVFLLVNVVRAVATPGDFAAYLGAPLAAPADEAWVLVYASRTAVLAAVALLLVHRGLYRVLGSVYLVGVVAPITDLVVSAEAGAGADKLAFHVFVAGYLVLTGVALLRTTATGRPS
jgi:hypothetical protein